MSKLPEESRVLLVPLLENFNIALRSQTNESIHVTALLPSDRPSFSVEGNLLMKRVISAYILPDGMYTDLFFFSPFSRKNPKIHFFFGPRDRN